MKINSLKKQKHGNLIHNQSDKAFMGTIVILTLTSLHGGSLKSMLTVPLIQSCSRSFSAQLRAPAATVRLRLLEVTFQPHCSFS